MADVTVIGGGLAGCEAAWQLAEAGFSVQLLEMKPVQYTPAHHYEGLAELVCSNSLKADRINSAAGLLKAEMTRLGSLLMQCARKSAVAAGGALAVDRKQFSDLATDAIRNHPNITLDDRRGRSYPGYSGSRGDRTAHRRRTGGRHRKALRHTAQLFRCGCAHRQL